VAVLTFADQTRDLQNAHWRYSLPQLLQRQLTQVKALQMLPDGAVGSAERLLKARPGAALDAARARKMGQLLQAQQVVWGDYHRDGGKWHVRARVLNVTRGKGSGALRAAAADWFAVRDELTAQILKGLGVTPSEAERARMARRATTSPAAWEWFSKAYALGAEGKPPAEQEVALRKAIAADAQYADAYTSLAWVLSLQAKHAQGEKAARHALAINPDDATAHKFLAIRQLQQGQLAEAERELREAHRLDPDDPEPLNTLGQLEQAQEKWSEAAALFDAAQRLDPTDARIHANLGVVYVFTRARPRALSELKAAARLNVGDVETEKMLTTAYARLGETPLAVEHCDKLLRLARQQGVNPEDVRVLEEQARRLKATQTPHFLTAAMPKVYTDAALQQALRSKLTKEELAIVPDPLASSPAMKRWAQRLTRGARNDLDKARKLFDALVRSCYVEEGSRTAREVFAAWDQPGEAFDCQEYARLFVALARDVGVPAFYADVQKDNQGKGVYHACAAVFTQGKLLLVDPAYHWFGVPHQKVVVLDDLQAIAEQLFQGEDLPLHLARCRLGTKLDPASVYGQLALAEALIQADQWEEAGQAVAAAARLEPERWEVLMLRGGLALHEGHLEAALDAAQKAVAANPARGEAHGVLALVLQTQGKLEAARAEYQAALRDEELPPSKADVYRRAVAQIDQQLQAGGTQGAR
jgi:tetratricopeptide (TPR) repeat protein